VYKTYLAYACYASNKIQSVRLQLLELDRSASVIREQQGCGGGGPFDPIHFKRRKPLRQRSAVLLGLVLRNTDIVMSDI